MAGLMLKFPSGDRIVVNGAVLENVGRGARLRVLTPDTQLLRLRDAVDPAKATTPVGRLSHAVQMMLLGECDIDTVLAETLVALTPLRLAFVAEDDRALVDEIVASLGGRHFYRALRQLGQLRRRETVLLAHAGP